MRILELTVTVAVSAATAVLVGCGNPEEAARAALTEANGEWSNARGTLDPQDRVAAYSEVIEAVEEIAEDYPETPDGRAIASGVGVVEGLSLAALKGVRDELAVRVPCYSRPTVACLTPFASNMRAAADAGSPDAILAAVQETVCAQSFAAADRLLEPFKINRPAYAEQLVQVALAAAECGKSGEVAAAIDAYRTAEPATGAARAQSLLSILATEPLKPAWPSVLAELDRGLASRSFAAQDAATIALTMALRHAELGDVPAATAKYAYFTDTLNYEADWSSKLGIGSALIAAGAPEAGIKVVETNDMRQFVVIGVTQAAALVGRRADVVGESAAQPQLFDVQSLDDYLAPIDTAQRAQFTASVATVETELDKLARVATIQDSAIGLSGIDNAYGVLALVHVKLGAADKAGAAIDKAMAFRGRLLQNGAENVGMEYFAPFRTLVALAQGKHAEAAEHMQAINVRHDYVRLLLKSMAEAGKVEEALTVAGQVQANNPRASYNTIIEALIGAGKLDDAERVIAAFTGGADEKRLLQWQLVNKAASGGDPQRAAALAAKYGLVNGPRDRLQLLVVALSSEKTAGDRDEAEPIIREIFAIGQELDGAGGGSFFERNDSMIAQDAAWHAFRGGHTDLGMELYRAAGRKDQRPLFEAFNDKVDDDDLPALLMLAHDNLRGAELGYVIDAAIRHLGKEDA